jgi:hypothetical protein
VGFEPIISACERTKTYATGTGIYISLQIAYLKVKVKFIPQQAEVAQGVPGRLRPPDLRDVRHYNGGISSAIRTGRLYPRRNPWY